MSISADKIMERHDQFMKLINKDSRADKLLVMYEQFGEQLAEAPASRKSHYHNAFPGGYIDHVVRVAESAMKVSRLYKEMGGDIDFTSQECIFSALHHDLGKLGMEGTPYYIDQESDWHRKRGEVYTHNPELGYMTVPDRALFLLQKYGIEITQKEFLGIKLADGMYDESNKSYLASYDPYPIRTSLPRILHVADYLSSRVEGDILRF
jgi:hypothetical protein